MTILKPWDSNRTILNAFVLDELDVAETILNNFSIGCMPNQGNLIAVDAFFIVNRYVDWFAFKNVDDYWVATKFSLCLRSPYFLEVSMYALDLSIDNYDAFKFTKVDLSIFICFLLDAFFKPEDLMSEGEIDYGVFKWLTVLS